MKRVQLQPAYVLHSRAFRESSQLMEVFTRDHGRIGIVARGSRGPRSKLRHVLQPFRPLLVSWSHRGDLGTLTGADQVAAPPSLNAEALYCGLYVNELIMRLLHRHDPHPEVFERYRQTLAGLAMEGPDQRSLRLFEKHLLDATGFGMVLDREAASEAPLEAELWYEYRPDSGPSRVSEKASDRPGVVSGRVLQSLGAETIENEDLPMLKILMRRVLRHHLGEKPLASEALFRSLASKRGSGATRS